MHCTQWWQALVRAPCDLPCIAAGEVRTQALTVAADAALLQALAAVATTVVPPADFQLARLKKASRSATPGSSRRLRSSKKQPSILLSNAVVAFQVFITKAITLHTTVSVDHVVNEPFLDDLNNLGAIPCAPHHSVWEPHYCYSSMTAHMLAGLCRLLLNTCHCPRTLSEAGHGASEQLQHALGAGPLCSCCEAC